MVASPLRAQRQEISVSSLPSLGMVGLIATDTLTSLL